MREPCTPVAQGRLVDQRCGAAAAPLCFQSLERVGVDDIERDREPSRDRRRHRNFVNQFDAAVAERHGSQAGSAVHGGGRDRCRVDSPGEKDAASPARNAVAYGLAQHLPVPSRDGLVICRDDSPDRRGLPVTLERGAAIRGKGQRVPGWHQADGLVGRRPRGRQRSVREETDEGRVIQRRRYRRMRNHRIEDVADDDAARRLADVEHPNAESVAGARQGPFTRTPQRKRVLAVHALGALRSPAIERRGHDLEFRGAVG